MQHYRLDIALAEEYHDVFLGYLLLEEFQFVGTEQTADAYQLYIEMADEQAFAEYLKALESLMSHYDMGTLVGHSLLEDKNWNEEWEKGLRSVDVPPFFIKPDVWKGAVPEERIVLRINPKMAFGTGYHETTRLVLSMIPEYCTKGCSVIDAGAGTGVLSIAALKIGAKVALGFDIDPWSKVNAEENARLNQVEDSFEVYLGSVEQLQGKEKADLVMANINRNALVELLPDISQYVKSNGILVLSGLLESDKDDIMSLELLESNYKPINYKNEGEWIALAFKKN